MCQWFRTDNHVCINTLRKSLEIFSDQSMQCYKSLMKNSKNHHNTTNSSEIIVFVSCIKSDVNDNLFALLITFCSHDNIPAGCICISLMWSTFRCFNDFGQIIICAYVHYENHRTYIMIKQYIALNHQWKIAKIITRPQIHWK